MNNQIETASREVLWNVSSTANVVLMYVLFFISLVIFANGFIQRLFLWKSGKAASERFGDWKKRAIRIWEYVAKQKGVNRDKQAKIFHSLIVWGFLVLLFTTTMVFIDQDLGIKIYRGYFYLAVTVFSDLFGLGLIFGVIYAVHRRYIAKPDKLHNTLSASIILVLLALMCVQGFVLEGLRIHATTDPWAMYSPVGLGFSKLFWGLSIPATKSLHFITWWVHTVTVFGFIAIFPYTNFLHIFSSSANLFFKDISRPKGALSEIGDIELMMEDMATSDSDDFSLGISNAKDLSWKQLLDMDACTSCGRCQDICPAYNTGKPLSPKWLMLDTKHHINSLYVNSKLTESSNFFVKLDQWLVKHITLPTTSTTSSDQTRASRGTNEAVQRAANNLGLNSEDPLSGEVLDENVFWSCTTCRACEEVCPVGVEHIDHIMGVRRSMALMEGRIPSEAQQSLRAIETRGNPFGPTEDRSDWAKGLSVNFLESGQEVDLLYWVGCVSAYDQRKQSIAKSMVKILNASGLNWGILGNKESCTGDPARRLGEENLYQTQAKCNITTLSDVKFKRIVANCPHCFNTLKNEYPEFEGFSSQIPVLHHSELIHELINSKKLSIDKQIEKSLTFHDPCYLGRHNDTYKEPREVLVQLGGKQTEMKDNKEKGMCCGAGGGHFWMDLKLGERVNVKRIKQAEETGADTVATGCPFCLQMLEDGVKLSEKESNLEVKDIAELVAESIS